MRIYISYSVEPRNMGTEPEIDSTLRELAEKLGGENPDSGSGFGGRDLTFEFDDKVKGKKFISQIKKLKFNKDLEIDEG